MSTYDDWVVRFKINTQPLDAALKKVNQLRQAMNGLYGGGGSPGPGRGSGPGSGTNRTPAQEQAQRNRDFYASQRDLNHNQRLRERNDAAQQRAFNANLRSIRQAAKRQATYRAEQRRLANAEFQAYREDAKRQQAQARQMEADRLRSMRASGNAGAAAASWQRRRQEAISGLTSGNPQARNMRSYYAGLEARDAARRTSIQQMRDVQLASMNAAARRQAERQAAQQSRSSLQQGNRQSNFDAAVRSRNYQLNDLGNRMNWSGVGDRGRLEDLRQRLGAATNQTGLNAMAPEMRQFVRETNRAIAAQNRLQRQLDQNNFATRSLSNSMANMARSYLSIFAVVGGGKAMYNNAKEMENLQTKLLMGTGSRGEAKEAYGFIRAKAQETGLGIGQTTNLYSQMAITAKDAGMNKDQIRKVFNDTTTMQIGYGLGPDQQKLVTKAIVQMMSFSE